MTVWEQLINSEAEALFSIVRKEQEERWSHIIRAGEQLKREREISNGLPSNSR